MPWLKTSDQAGTHPRVLGVAGLPGADARTVNEVFGFVSRLATLAAGHMTDYHLDVGTIAMVAGPTEVQRLLKLSRRAGLMEPVPETTPAQWRIVEDPELLHMRSAEEVTWDRQRKRDLANKDLTAYVRHRDGDACRYCQRTVNWRDRKSARGGTYDHVIPGRAATRDTLVVACFGCNRQRGANPTLQPGPPPERPLWGPDTRTFLEAQGYEVEGHRAPGGPRSAERATRTVEHDPETSSQGATPPETPCTPDPAALSARPGASATSAWDTAPGSPPPFMDLPDSADPRSPARDGSGRDGSGQVRSGGGEGGARRRRGRRSRRGGGGPGG